MAVDALHHGAWVGLYCMNVTFSGHTHLLVGTYQGYIGCLGWYALYICDVSWSYSLTIWDLSGLYWVLGSRDVSWPYSLTFWTYQDYFGCLGCYALYDCDVSWPYSLTIWDLSGLYLVLGWYALYICDVSWSYSLTIWVLSGLYRVLGLVCTV